MFDCDRSLISAAFLALSETMKLQAAMLEESRQQIAYRLWEEAGKPDGRSDEFWFKAGQIMQEQLMNRQTK